MCPRCVVTRVVSPAEAPLDAVPSRRLGAYELIEEVGRGGMGYVWRARQLGLDRVVAVKTLRAGVAAGESARARFQREALALARVNHPGIVAVHEVGEEDGEPFLVMEFIRDETLAQRLASGPLVAREAASLVATLADAVAAAHAAGVIHRDLKPSNVLLDAGRDGAPRLTDFGVALLAGDDGSLTAPLEGIGTLAYLAPEQLDAHSGPVGPATDVHGLGTVLYHCLTGHPPFAGATPAEVLRQILEQDQLSPRRRWSAVPTDLDAICQRCLRKDPAARFPDASALREDLHRHLRGLPVHSRPVSALGRWRRWMQRQPALAAAAGLVCLLLGVSAGLWLQARSQGLAAIARQRVGALTTNWPVQEPSVGGTVSMAGAGWRWEAPSDASRLVGWRKTPGAGTASTTLRFATWPGRQLATGCSVGTITGAGASGIPAAGPRRSRKAPGPRG
jgi:serine/threonine-protein kinase